MIITERYVSPDHPWCVQQTHAQRHRSIMNSRLSSSSRISLHDLYDHDAAITSSVSF